MAARNFEDFIYDGLNYEAAMAAYQAQFASSSNQSWNISSDPDIEHALRARQEFYRSQESLRERYTPQQLQSLGLSPLSGSPLGGTPYIQSLRETAPHSTRNTPFQSNRTTPFQSPPPQQQSPFPPPQQQWATPTPNPSSRQSPMTPAGRRSSGGSGGGSGSGQGSRSRRSRGGGGSCCFGGGNTNSPPVSPLPGSPPLPPVAEDEDHDRPRPDAHGFYYRVHRGEVDLGTQAGRAFRTHLNNLIHSTYQNCFIKWKQLDPANLDYIDASLDLHYPNPAGHKYSRQWMEDHVKQFLKNKKSSTRRAARKAFEDPDHNHRPGQVHDIEWETTMAERYNEHASGQRSHSQQRDARARQTPTHYGSGGKKAWKDKYVSNIYFYLIKLYSFHVKYEFKLNFFY